MESKADIIRNHLKGLSVLDIGGSGYGGDNPYERELKDAWRVVKSRSVVDIANNSDIPVNLNSLPLPRMDNQWDITIAFDVLEHLEHPTEVLRWVPTERMIVCLPNDLSPLLRRMERCGQFAHLYSFSPYTARVLIENSGSWKVEKHYFSFGKWSLTARLINLLGNVFPAYVGTGLVLHCQRIPAAVQGLRPPTA